MLQCECGVRVNISLRVNVELLGWVLFCSNCLPVHKEWPIDATYFVVMFISPQRMTNSRYLPCSNCLPVHKEWPINATYFVVMFTSPQRMTNSRYLFWVQNISSSDLLLLSTEIHTEIDIIFPDRN